MLLTSQKQLANTNVLIFQCFIEKEMSNKDIDENYTEEELEIQKEVVVADEPVTVPEVVTKSKKGKEAVIEEESPIINLELEKL